MRAHLVFAHPLPDSLGAHLSHTAEAALRARGLEIDRLDLYAEAFQPALTPGERRHYYAEPQSDPDAIALQQRLAEADILVLVFPTWWFGLPAILKGWFDRVWAPGFAFDQGTPIKPRLTRLRSCLVVTTLGSPWCIDTLVMRQPLRRILKTAILGACAPQARFTMLSLHAAETVDPPRLRRFENRIARAVETL